MNIYFLVEGKRTEKIVYPKWISILIPELKNVERHYLVTDRNYYLFSANGQPSLIYDCIPAAISDMNSNGKYKYLVVCLDSDENTVYEKINEINEYLKEKNVFLKNGQVQIIVQNRCFETWLLGNRKIYCRNPQNLDLRKYTKYYNVSTKDPELMRRYNGFNTDSQFHYNYLKKLFREKNITYNKCHPGHATSRNYITQLKRRINENKNHLKSFRHFVEFCKQIRSELI